ncbi:MAG: CpaF family protein [Actinomycetota bacterium]
MADRADFAELPIFAPANDATAGPERRTKPVERTGWIPTPPVATRQHADTPPERMSNTDSDGSVDWGLVRALRQQAAKLLADELRDRTVPTEREREIGREIIHRLLDEHVDAQVRGGDAAGLFTPSEQDMLARAVFDSLFGLGRLQPLVDDESVENIEVRGNDRVTLVRTGGLIEDGPPVAGSDEELLEQLQFLASRSSETGRPFSPADPQLDLRLHGGHRLAASAWTTPRPSVVIRRHRLIDVDLTDLVGLGLMDTRCAEFLAACVRARKSIVVAGEQGAGKTTLLRALCNEIDLAESIGTIETEYELHLDELPDRHPRVFAWEARPGNGQVAADGTAAGEVTLARLLYNAHRYNLSRVIVGEVRGAEVSTMFQAMQSGAGSLSTLHARDARGAVERLVTLALEGSGGGAEHAYRQVAHHIDVMVHITMRDVRGSDGVRQRRRFVSEVVAVDPGDAGRPAFTDVFATEGGQLKPGVPPRWLDELVHAGYPPHAFNGGEPR